MMPLLHADPAGTAEVTIIDHLPDGRVVVRFTRSDAVMTVPSHLLSAADGEEPLAPERRSTKPLTAAQITVLQALDRAGPFGLTDDEHEAINGLRSDSAGVRRKELERRQFVAFTGDTRPTRRGVRARVWRITTAGEDVLRSLDPIGAP